MKRTGPASRQKQREADEQNDAVQWLLNRKPPVFIPPAAGAGQGAYGPRERPPTAEPWPGPGPLFGGDGKGGAP